VPGMNNEECLGASTNGQQFSNADSDFLRPVVTLDFLIEKSRFMRFAANMFLADELLAV
jgi:hypothetical protein